MYLHRFNSAVLAIPKEGLPGMVLAKPSFGMTMTKILQPVLHDTSQIQFDNHIVLPFDMWLRVASCNTCHYDVSSQLYHFH